MFKLNDIISAGPESSSKSVAVPARVCYIHPMGRFYELEFHFRKGSGAVYRESRFFTPSEYEEGLAKGLFNPRASMKRKTPCPPGYSRGFLDDDFYMQEQQSKKSAEFDPAMF